MFVFVHQKKIGTDIVIFIMIDFTVNPNIDWLFLLKSQHWSSININIGMADCKISVSPPLKK